MNEGPAATFSVTATGVQLQYQWRKGGADLTGQTGATLTLSAVALAGAGEYDVVVRNPGGSVRRSGVNLPGRTSSTLTLSAATPDDEGECDVVVTNPG